MSIQPPSDIVLDVAQAADPVKSMAATQRLTQMTPAGATSEEFSRVLQTVSPRADSEANLRSRLDAMGAPPVIGGKAAAQDAQAKAYKGLEALILQNLFETTLPHDESLGAGMAGDVWRSMLAEQLGKQTANMLDLGISKSESHAHGKANLVGPFRKSLFPVTNIETIESTS